MGINGRSDDHLSNVRLNSDEGFRPRWGLTAVLTVDNVLVMGRCLLCFRPRWGLTAVLT